MDEFADRWNGIQRTRDKDPNTNEPAPGSLGVAYVMWMNNIVEKVGVLTRVNADEVRIQKAQGGQIMNVSFDHVRTEAEVLEYIKDEHPDLIPVDRRGWVWHRRLPGSVLRSAWGRD